MDRDAQAMKRRDWAAAQGCRVCSACEGTGGTRAARCRACGGSTWLTQEGRRYEIDMVRDRAGRSYRPYKGMIK